MALTGAFVIALRSSKSHHGLNLMNSFVQFLLCFIVPNELVQVVRAVPKEGVGRGTAGRCLDQSSVGQGLYPMRIMRALGDLPCFLFNWNELGINDDDLVGSAT